MMSCLMWCHPTPSDSVVPTSGTFDVKLMKYGGSLGITINGECTTHVCAHIHHTRVCTHTPHTRRGHMTSHQMDCASAAGNTKPGDPIWINRLKKGGVAHRWVGWMLSMCHALLNNVTVCCASGPAGTSCLLHIPQM